VAAPEAGRFATQPVEPTRFWIRHAPQRWPGPEEPWLDLARAALGGRDGDAVVAGERPLEDLLYLPPIDPARAGERDSLAGLHLERGTPVLLQLRPGEPPPPPPAVAVYDLSPPLLAGDLAGLRLLPPGAAAVWPLLAGLTDGEELWEEGCALLAGAGVRTVQALAPSLSPADRRRLAEGRGDEVFHALFHRPPRAERDFARAAHRFGLAPFLPRPLPRPPLGGAANRRLAADLLLAAELWLAVGRPAGRGLALSRAARWVDEASYDVPSLARDGNLGVIEALDSASQALIAERFQTGHLPLLDELLAEYLGA
jgi:hypothetical protein